MPQIDISTDIIRGSITLAITNPTPSEGQPSVSYNDIYRTGKNENNYVRIATNVNDSYTDYTPECGKLYE
jgi:hypothetical protein